MSTPPIIFKVDIGARQMFRLFSRGDSDFGKSFSSSLPFGLMLNIGNDKCLPYRKPFQVSHLKLEICNFPSIQDVISYLSQIFACYLKKKNTGK